VPGRSGHRDLVSDPLALDLPLLKKPLHFYQDPAEAPAILRELDAKIRAADAYIIITAEYNREMPPGLTNLMNHFPPRSFAFKTSAIVAYSIGGSLKRDEDDRVITFPSLRS
jgi:NAD(P)H-dependent FMN reductase